MSVVPRSKAYEESMHAQGLYDLSNEKKTPGSRFCCFGIKGKNKGRHHKTRFADSEEFGSRAAVGADVLMGDGAVLI